MNTRDMVHDLTGTIVRAEQLFRQYNVTPLAINSGVSPQLHDRSPNTNEQRLREIRALVQFMNHFGIEIAAIQPRNPDRTRPWEEVLTDCVQTLQEHLEIGEAGGVTFALELHVNSPFETLDQARRLFESLPEMPVVYDPTHFVMQGVQVHDTGWLVEHAAHVHLRDAALGKMQARFGEGDVDFDWVIQELQQRNYQGHISIEYLESNELDILEDVIQLKNKLEAHF